MWSYLTSPVVSVVFFIGMATTMLALATVSAMTVGVVIVCAGRIKRENAGLIASFVFFIGGTVAWAAWQPLVTALVLAVPSEWVKTFAIWVCLASISAAVGALLLFSSYDTRLSAYAKRRAGEVGEQKVRKALSKAGFEAIHGLYVPFGKGARQLDHVVRVGRCLIVLETKNWQGLLYGKPDEPTWTQKLDGKKSNRDNPILQLQGQIKALAQVTGCEVRGFVVFGNRCEFPHSIPAGAMHIHDIAQKLNMLALAAPTVDANSAVGWDKVVAISLNVTGQASLKIKHDAWNQARPAKPGAEGLPFVKECSTCGERTSLTLREPAKPGFSWFWRCECKANTSISLAHGWRFERQGQGFVCVAADGDRIPV